jgi:hypothetical protein
VAAAVGSSVGAMVMFGSWIAGRSKYPGSIGAWARAGHVNSNSSKTANLM